LTFVEVLNACANVGANERPCVPTKSTSLNAILSKINMWEVAMGIGGKYDWVVPLGTSHLKF
jgi:hypothetical protein